MQTKFHIAVALVLSIILLLTTACLNSSAPTQTAPATAAREVTDDLGRRVKVPEKIERFVSLAPNLTENVFAVGAGERLVGVTTYCNFPAEAQKISKVGDTINPNLETILALKPQLVLVSTASQIESFTRQMEERGIAVFVLNPKDFEGVLQNLRLLGDLLGTQSNAEKLVSDLQARVSLVENKISGEKPVRVFVQISREPLYTIGRASFLTDLIKRAGGESITLEVPEAYPKISKEMVLASQPEAVILSADDAMGEGNSTAADVLRDSPAVKDNRVYKINGDLLTRPSPRLVDGLEEIARALHPQVFR
ncbi:MAG TPA: cobalamin-binding protein [Pyrinomonadaceae bacterium]|nr:cobalamin-binding protein [Pyrinomonadaceae bacterium]